MKKQLENLAWDPHWISHLGSLKGCLDYLKADISTAWLYGGSGHAFINNIHEVVCPSGPTAWRKEQFLNLIANLGIVAEPIVSHKSMKDFQEKQKLIWRRVRDAIDNDQPVVGWELLVPEYYVINGYDDEGYYYSGPAPENNLQPKKWQELGQTEIGIIEVYLIGLDQPLDDKIILRDALQFAVDFSSSPAAWVFQDYKSGTEGYDVWIHALKNKTADLFGVAYNAAVWTECRSFAVEFLHEAEQRIGGELAPLLAEAATCYAKIAQNLKVLTKIFPFKPEALDQQVKIESSQLDQSIAALRQAKAGEVQAMVILQKILDQLPGSKGVFTGCD